MTREKAPGNAGVFQVMPAVAYRTADGFYRGPPLPAHGLQGFPAGLRGCLLALWIEEAANDHGLGQIGT